MSETKNCGLHLTDNRKELFKEWQETMSGTNNSNMIKIDNAIGEKADHSVVVDVVLLASAWTGSEAPFTQELSVTGLKADHNGFISIAHGASPAQRSAMRDGVLCLVGQSAGKLVVAADGDKPEVDIPVSIVLVD